MKTLTAQCADSRSWHKDKVTETLQVLGEELKETCGRVSTEAWIYCKCEWFPSLDPRLMLQPNSRAEEPDQLTVKLLLSSPDQNENHQDEIRAKIVEAVRTVPETLGSMQSGISNKKTMQSLYVSINDEQAVQIHIYDTTALQISWFMQKSKSIGVAFRQLNQILGNLKQFSPTISDLLLNLKIADIQSEICDI
jgi:hypothetical protein